MKPLQLILLSITMLFLITSPLDAQKTPMKFGKVSMDEMKMTVYDKDSTADAVILADFGVSEMGFTPDFNLVIRFTRHTRIKILKKDGLDYADVTVRLYESNRGKEEDFGSFKAQTYNLEKGKIVEAKITRKEVFTEQESKHWKLKKFALPNVKVGSVIEYKYTITSPFVMNFQPWYFQDEIPIIWSEYRTKTPEYFDFKKVFGGYISPEISENNAYSASFPGGNGTYTTNFERWVFKDVPAFKDEKYITTPRDYLAKVEFEINSFIIPGSVYETYSTTWKKIVDELMKTDYFGGALNRKSIVKELTDQINPDGTPQQKLLSAYVLIKKHMKWNGEHGRYIENSLRDAFNKNEGNKAEINLLLVNLLRSVGIEAHPVLISTRSHGRINQFYPREAAFNSVLALAKIDGKNILLDPTISYLKPGELPFSCLNGKGLVAVKENAYWVSLLSGEKQYTSSMIIVNIKEEKIEAQLVKSYQSLTATVLRGRIAKEGKEKYIENKKEKNPDWEITEYTIENETDISKPLSEKIKVANITNIDASGDMIYIPAVLTDEIEENPFSSEAREYPVDFATPIYEKHMIIITVPKGFSVEELPQPAKVALPNDDASFIYQAQKSGNNIQIMVQLKINKAMFLPKEYQLLKELYRNIIEKYGEQIVLKKTTE